MKKIMPTAKKKYIRPQIKIEKFVADLFLEW
jgi:hypothetical protein